MVGLFNDRFYLINRQTYTNTNHTPRETHSLLSSLKPYNNRIFSYFSLKTYMASKDTMTIFSSMHMHEQDDDDDDGDEHEHDHHHLSSHTMSRVSICTTNSRNSIFDDDDDEEDDMIMNMSRLYVDHESEVEADGEFSDGKDGKEGSIGSEDFDKEMGWFSLPASPYGRIGGVGVEGITEREVKEYGSENEGKRGWRRLRERWLERAWEMRKCKAADEEVESISNNPCGESECAVIARPKRGGKCLCMDIEEVKACRDLGFDLQQDWTLEIPSGISVSSTMDTDSGGNSPISNWRISTAGDDPRDVKARLKVWAQAVALASTYSLSG